MCLQIPELLSQIIEACAPGYRDQSSSLSCSRLGTVAALARTCRTFQDSALDVLWYSQYGMLNLLWCLPDDKWELRESDGMVRGLPDNLVTELSTVQRVRTQCLLSDLHLICFRRSQPGFRLSSHRTQ